MLVACVILEGAWEHIQQEHLASGWAAAAGPDVRLDQHMTLLPLYDNNCQSRNAFRESSPTRYQAEKPNQ